MASGSHHCKDCGLYFDSARSLEVHLQYHKENLMNMWMGTENNSREGGPLTGPITPQGSEVTPIGSGNSLGASVNTEGVNTVSAFTAPSPMQYDYKTSPGLQSPHDRTVPQGPSSHGSVVSFPHQSPGSYYNEYNNQQMQHQQQHQQQYGGYQGGFHTTGYDENFYGNSTSTTSRFHPYIGRSPVPTPSPNSLHVERKEENPVQESPDILDLDSQKVLGNALGQPQNPHQMGLNQLPHQNAPIPPMWRPHEQFPNPCSMSPYAPSSGISPMHQAGYPGPYQQPQGPLHMSGMMPTSGFHPAGPGVSYSPQGFSPTQPPMNGPRINSPFGVSAASPSRDSNSSSELTSNVKRPKSFKCEDCNKWFTSHGHLKRHYNTTLHKNMMKLNNGNNATDNSTSNTNSARTTPDPTRPPILSPGAKSIGEASTVSSIDEESNLSSSDNIQAPTPPPMQYQPPTSVSAYQPPSLPLSGYQPPGIPPVSQGMQVSPQFSQLSYIGSEQPATIPTQYHGHFSTNTTGYVPQSSSSMSNGPSFYQGGGGSNFGGYNPQGSHLVSVFQPANEYPGPQNNSLEAFANFKLEEDTSLVSGSQSPEPSHDDEGSEASMDSSESLTSSSTPTPGNTDSFRCHDCGKFFNRMCYLTQHRSTYHEGEKPFKCATCGKRFTDEITFNDHQGKHAGEKPYKCEVCPKQFNHKTDLRRHMCLHTGEKPFTCEQCGKGFIRKDHMLKHFQTHRKKALAAASSNMPPHPSHVTNMVQHSQGFQGHIGHGIIAQVPLGHSVHGPSGHPGHPGNASHPVAPPVY
ncbi:unnamed protein product [Meganyctiphanes norvegica]|uniref:C2H2-type domain-containing protein n=1 Tax=Meganyctiphanes norvegica TaxID=48144 RepID=A0AAV2SCJ0_MEGNR